MFKLFCTGLTALTLGLAAAGAAAQAPMRLAYVAPVPVWGPAADRFAQLAGEKTQGAVKIQTFGGGQLGNLPLSIAGLRTGQVDMVLIDTGALALAKGGRDLAILSAPYAFRDRAHFRAFLASPTWREMISAVEKEAGFTYVGYVSDRMPRQLSNSLRAVTKPEDMKGLKIRVPENQLFLETMKAWGASPVPVPAAELYIAMKQGLVHGQENGFDAVVGAKFHEVQKYATRLDYVQAGLLVLISSTRWNQLSADQRKALIDAAAETDRLTSAEVAKAEAEVVAAMKANGMEVSEPNLEPFRALAEKVNQRFEGELWPAGSLARIRAVK